MLSLHWTTALHEFQTQDGGSGRAGARVGTREARGRAGARVRVREAWGRAGASVGRREAWGAAL